MRRLPILAGLSAALLLSGCFGLFMKRPYHKHGIVTPEMWQAAAASNQGKTTNNWVKTFKDRELVRLVKAAMKHNPDLQEAAARMESAKQGAIIGRAARFPSINFSGSARRTQRRDLITITPEPTAMLNDAAGSAAAAAAAMSGNGGGTMPSAPTTGGGSMPMGTTTGTMTTTTTVVTPTSPGTSGTTGASPAPMMDAAAAVVAPAAAVITPEPPEPITRLETVRESDYGLTLDASWEVDLWGRLRDLDHASYEDYVAAQADFHAAQLSLAANTAKAWFNLITTQQQIELAEKTLDSFVRNNRIIERNYIAGDETASPLDVQFARNNVAQAERALVTQKLAKEEASRALEVFVGDYPTGKLDGGDELPKLTKDVPAGLPSELLSRRPDLVAAEAAVRASAKRADASRKSLLPSFIMTGAASTASPRLDSFLVDPDAIVWTAAYSVAQSIFEGGANRAQAKQALAQNEITIRRYASLVLQALREVESALATERSLAEQERYLNVELRQANLAERQASRDYAEGIVGILEVLEAQRRAVSARNSMINLRNQRLQNRVDLHLALGGDFEGS